MKTKILITILMLCNAFLYATGYNAKAIISKDAAFIGDVLKLDLIVNSSSLPTEASISSDEALSVKKLKPFDKLEGTEDTYTSTYQIVPIIAGELKIPSFVLENAEADSFITNPIIVNIEKPENSEDMLLIADYSPKKVFIGQAINIHYIWKSLHPLNTIKSVNINIPSFDEENFKSYINANYINSENKSAIGLPVHNRRLVGKTEILKFDETRRAYCVSFETIAIPLNAGTFTLESPTLVCAVPKDKDVSEGVPQRFIEKRFLYPAYFDNEFFNYQTEVSTLKKQFVKANDLEIEVLPLPLEGMPENFSYIVGDYTISASVPDTNVRVGDTIDLNISIKALNGASLETVQLKEEDFLGLGFEKFEISKNLLGLINGKEKNFNIKLLVRSIESVKIPTINFSFFNPETEEYKTINTEEFNLMVSPSQSTRMLAEDGTEILIKSKLTKNKIGIYDAQVDEDFFKAKEKKFIGNMSLGLFLICTLITPIIFLGIYIKRLIKKIFLESSSFRDRVSFSLRLKSISLKSEISATDIEAIIQELFSLRIKTNKASMTFVEIESFLKEKQCPVALIAEMSEIFECLRSDSYAENNAKNANKDLLKKTIKLLKKINRNLK